MTETPEVPSAVVYGENNDTLSPIEALSILQQPDTDKISFHVAISPQPGQMFLYSGEEKIRWQKDGHNWLNCGKHDFPFNKPVCKKAYYRERLPSGGLSHLRRDVFTAFETENTLILVHYLTVHYTSRRYVKKGQQIKMEKNVFEQKAFETELDLMVAQSPIDVSACLKDDIHSQVLGNLSEERATKRQRPQKSNCLEKQKRNQKRRRVSIDEVLQHGHMKETPSVSSAVVYGENNDTLTPDEALNILQQPDTDKISFHAAISPQPGQMFLYSGEDESQWRKDGHKWCHHAKHDVPKAKPVCRKAYYKEKVPAGGMSFLYKDVFTALETGNKLTLVHYVLIDQKSRRLVVKNGKQIKTEENELEQKTFETQSDMMLTQSPMEGAACRKDDIHSQVLEDLSEERATKSLVLTTKKRKRRKKWCLDYKYEQKRKRKTTPVASTSSKTTPVTPTCRRTTLLTPLDDKWQSHKSFQPTVKIEPLTDAEDEWQRKLNSYIIHGGASFTNAPVKTVEVPPVDKTIFTCFKCGLQFHQRFRLQGHLKWHESTVMKGILYTCENCGLHYKRLSCLKSHIALVHVSRWVSKRGGRGRKKGRHRPKEENRQKREENREEIDEDCGVDRKQGDEEADQENYLHHTVEENDRVSGSQCSGEESNQMSDHHQQNTDEEIVHNHVGGRNNLEHEDRECADVGNDKQHEESEAEISVENNEEHDRHHEDTNNEETDENCHEDVDYIIEENDQSSEDDEQADEETNENENDACFNDENGDNGGSILTFKSTDGQGCQERNKTTASLKTEISPQPIERRSTRVSSICRSQRISSNAIVGQTRSHGDIEQRKESPGSHGNGRRKRSHGEESAEGNNGRKKCRESEELICRDCGLKCKHKADLRKHELWHKRIVKVLHCRVCQREYTSHQDLLKHVSDEHVIHNPSTNEIGDDQIETHRLNEKLHICFICGLKLTRPSHLLNHLWRHIIRNKNRSRKEQQSNGQRNGDCEDVEKAGGGDGRLLPSKDAFVTETIRSVTDDFHTDADEIPTDICSKDITADNSSDQPEVQRTNLKPFKCRMCANAFALQDDLQNHKVVHREEKPVSKPFQCRTCRKTFSTAQTLRIHSKRHVGSKKSARQKSSSDKRRFREDSNSKMNSKMSLRCCECDTSFKSNVSFMRHVVLHNLRGLQHVCRATDGDCAFLRFKDDVKKFRSYVCEFCQKAFLTPSQLRLHVMVHTGEKCHHCSLCEAGFADVGNLKTHMRTHTGEKPFCCDVCGMRFSQNSNLKAHLSRHTSEKPFKCNDCSKEFHQLSHLRSHQELYQKDKYMYRVHQQRIINARKMHELSVKAAEEGGGEKEVLNGTDGDGQTIVEQYDYDTDEEQELLRSPESGGKIQKSC